MRFGYLVACALCLGYFSVVGSSYATPLQDDAAKAYRELTTADITAGAYVRPYPSDREPKGQKLGEFVAVRCYASPEDITRSGRFDIIKDLGRQAFLARKGGIASLTNIYFFVPPPSLSPTCANLFGGRATSISPFGE